MKEISRLKKELQSESNARLTDVEHLQTLENSVTKLTQENSDLKKDLKESEENWKAQISDLQKKLDSVTAELTRLKKMVTSMVASLVGKND